MDQDSESISWEKQVVNKQYALHMQNKEKSERPYKAYTRSELRELTC